MDSRFHTYAGHAGNTVCIRLYARGKIFGDFGWNKKIFPGAAFFGDFNWNKKIFPQTFRFISQPAYPALLHTLSRWTSHAVPWTRTALRQPGTS